MGLGKFLGKVATDIKERRADKREAQKMAEDEYREFEDNVNTLLDKFEITDFNKFLMKYLNNKPESKEEVDEVTGNIMETKPSRKDFLNFIWKHLDDKEINFNQLKDYALKNKVVSPRFFGDPRDEAFEKSDFESIVDEVQNSFEPEKIRNEEHLESQLIIFLKAKFPDRKINRQITTKNGDQLDIVVDNQYVFELKVPKNRTHLRNLSAQIEEYVEQYPHLCVVIADTSGVKEEDGEPVEANLTQDIKEYADKYKEKYSVQTIIYDIVTRK